MDNKAREVVKRSKSKFSPTKRSPNKQSRHKLSSIVNGGGGIDISEKPKRDKVGSLSFVNRESSSKDYCEMGGGSEGENEFQLPPLPPSSSTGSNKRFKFSRKPLDRHVVGNSPIPRKLRSAMNKRSHGSVSPPLSDAKKRHCTSDDMELPQFNSSKKFRHKRQGGDGTNSSGLITKDEEEVVEALYALASMFPDNKLVKNGLNHNNSESKPSSQETKENSSRVEGMKSQCASINAETSCVEGFPGETGKDNNLIKPSVLEQPTVSGNHKFDLGLDRSTAQADPGKTALLSKFQGTDDMPLTDASKLGVSSYLYRASGLAQSISHESPLHEHKQKNGLYSVATIVAKKEQQQLTYETSLCEQKSQNRLYPVASIEQTMLNKDNKESSTDRACTEGTLALWPTLSSLNSRCEEVHGVSKRSLTTEAPACLDSTSATGPGSTGNSFMTEKVHPIIMDRRQSRKRCVSHVYISYLIQAYRTAEKKAIWPVPSNQLKSNQRPDLGITANSNIIGNGLNGVISTGIRNDMHRITPVGDCNGSSAGRNPNEMPIQIIQDQKLQQNQRQTSKTSGSYIFQKQSCDFLSLSVGDGGCESRTTRDNSCQSGGNVSESPAQIHVPYLHSVAQHQALMPFSLPHAWYSSPYPNLSKAPEAQQLSQYLGGPFYNLPHMSHGGLAKNQQHHHPHQIWASQYGPEASVSNFPNWQNGRRDSDAPLPCSQPILTPSLHSLDMLSGKFPSRPQQRHLLVVSSSPSSSTGKRQQQHHLSSSVEGGVGFHAKGGSQLQLLCNAEHL